MSHSWARAALIAGLALTPPGLAGQTNGGAPVVSDLSDPSPIVLRPGDLLSVHIWPDQALGGEFPIEETGLVHLPVLGAVSAGGVALDDFRQELRTRYAEVLKQPLVTVVPRFPVYVAGEVARPGRYLVGPTATVFDVVSEAGGFSGRARRDRVRLMRDDEVVVVDFADVMEESAAPLPLLSVRSGDRILIPGRRRFFTLQNVYYVLQAAIWSVTLYELVRR